MLGHCSRISLLRLAFISPALLPLWFACFDELGCHVGESPATKHREPSSAKRQQEWNPASSHTDELGVDPSANEPSDDSLQCQAAPGWQLMRNPEAKDPVILHPNS